MDSQILLFSNFFIKNESHDTIHIFKNYFAVIFSVAVFSFSNNKFNPNGPLGVTWTQLVTIDITLSKIILILYENNII